MTNAFTLTFATLVTALLLTIVPWNFTARNFLANLATCSVVYLFIVNPIVTILERDSLSKIHQSAQEKSLEFLQLKELIRPKTVQTLLESGIYPSVMYVYYLNEIAHMCVLPLQKFTMVMDALSNHGQAIPKACILQLGKAHEYRYVCGSTYWTMESETVLCDNRGTRLEFPRDNQEKVHAAMLTTMVLYNSVMEHNYQQDKSQLTGHTLKSDTSSTGELEKFLSGLNLS
jgi:hypothetical protein